MTLLLTRDIRSNGYVAPKELRSSKRKSPNGGWALGDARFKRQIAMALGRRVAPLPKGRRSKAKAQRQQSSLLRPQFSFPLECQKKIHYFLTHENANSVRAGSDHEACPRPRARGCVHADGL